MSVYSRVFRQALGFIVLVSLVLSVVLIAATAPPEGADLGQTVYESKCATCHGKTGKGDTKAGQMTETPDMTQTPWKQGTGQAEVEKVLLEGLGKMPAYQEKLSGDEIRAVAEYVRELCGVADQ